MARAVAATLRALLLALPAAVAASRIALAPGLVLGDGMRGMQRTEGQPAAATHVVDCDSTAGGGLAAAVEALRHGAAPQAGRRT